MKYKQKILDAFERRQELYPDPGTDCFRLFHASADEIDGLCIDRYGEYLLIQFFTDGLYRDREGIMKAITDAVPRLPADVKGILLKDRRKTSAGGDMADKYESELIDGSMPPQEYVVMQGGIRAGVNLLSGQHTGIFMDMREIRRKLEQFYPTADHILNLFCYTAVFSVHALKYGAGGATNIDLSRPALERARRNYELNGLELIREDFIYGDSFEWIKIFTKKGRHFPLVIFDPPTFARNKNRSFAIKKDYTDNLKLISPIAAGSLVLTCVNTLSVSVDEYMSFHPGGWKNIFLGHESPDFPYRHKPYLKAGLWKVQDYH